MILGQITSCSTANKYLAEDRIMWHKIITRSGNWKISYIPNARCQTDPPTSIDTLLKQKRRWHNGSMFVSYSVLRNWWGVIYKEDCCKGFFHNSLFLLLNLFMLVSNILQYLTISLFFWFYYMVNRSVLEHNQNELSLVVILERIYLLCLFICIILSVSKKAEWTAYGFWILIIIMGLYSIQIFIFLLIGENDYWYYTKLLATILLLFHKLLPILYSLPCIILCDILQESFFYLFLSLTYYNIIPIYSIANIHDVTWDSENETASKASFSQSTSLKKRTEINYRNYRSNFMVIWLVINFITAYILIIAFENYELAILGAMAFLLMINYSNMLFYTIYLVMYYFEKEDWRTGNFFKEVRISFPLINI